MANRTCDSKVVDGSKKLDIYKSFSELPKWMTKNYVADALKQCESDPDLKLLDYQIVSATKPGNNFASIALRLKATYKTRGKEITKSFIVKVEHYEEGFKKEVMSEALLFETEILVYTKTIPEMQRLLSEVDPTETIAPPISFHSLQPNKVVFIDDLSPEFNTSDHQLNFEESVEIFKKIATFHALSFYLGESHEPMTKYIYGFFSTKTSGINEFLVQNMGTLGETIAEWGPEMEGYAKKLKALESTIFQKLLNVFAKNEGSGYNVLNHGDFHIKNILFRNQDKYPKAVDTTRLIDFQLSIWATPAIDLIFALYGMVGHEARERREELIRIYHEKFTHTLKKVGYLKNPPTLLDLQIELLRNGIMEVFMATFFMPLFYTDMVKAAEVKEMTIEHLTEIRKAVLRQPSMKSVLMKLFPIFDHKGFLEA